MPGNTKTKTKFDREKLARWYAKRHLDTDTGVVRIFHLPKGAPPNEIRFLEVNKLISDIGGADAHTLYVLDITPAQWEAIQKGKLALPKGWTLDGNQELAKR